MTAAQIVARPGFRADPAAVDSHVDRCTVSIVTNSINTGLYSEAKRLAVNRELDQFLQSVERRAFVKARLATGSEQEALDIVQDTMLRLVKTYRNKRVEEWGPLFQRILHSRITDWYRRQAVRNRLFAWFAKPADGDGGAPGEPASVLPDDNQTEPWENLSNKRLGLALQQALHALPLRQQQAFILRQWDGLNVQETARVMGCSQGSVKTHCSRAASTLKQALQKLGINAQTIDT